MKKQIYIGNNNNIHISLKQTQYQEFWHKFNKIFKEIKREFELGLILQLKYKKNKLKKGIS